MIPPRRKLASAGLSVAVLLSATAIAHAQEQPERIQFRGTVFDQETSAPVLGALVEVPGLDIAAATDSLGDFYLDLPWASSYVLYVEQLGYTSTRVPVFAETFRVPVVIAMAPDPVVMEGLKILVDRFRSRRRSSAYSVRTIDAESLARWGGSDMLTLLEGRIPFLRRCPNAPLQYCALFRGRTVTVRVCLDEFPAFGGVAQLAAYPPSEFHLIEIYRRGAQVRAYTRRFVERLTKNRRTLLPLSVRC